MTWNYRVIQYHGNKGYGLHEVYYDAAGESASPKRTTTGELDHVSPKPAQ